MIPLVRAIDSTKKPNDLCVLLEHGQVQCTLSSLCVCTGVGPTAIKVRHCWVIVEHRGPVQGCPCFAVDPIDLRGTLLIFSLKK